MKICRVTQLMSSSKVIFCQGASLVKLGKPFHVCDLQYQGVIIFSNLKIHIGHVISINSICNMQLLLRISWYKYRTYCIPTSVMTQILGLFFGLSNVYLSHDPNGDINSHLLSGSFFGESFNLIQCLELEVPTGITIFSNLRTSL